MHLPPGRRPTGTNHPERRRSDSIGFAFVARLAALHRNKQQPGPSGSGRLRDSSKLPQRIGDDHKVCGHHALAVLYLLICPINCLLVGTSHEVPRRTMETKIKQVVLPVRQCSCNEDFRCIDHDPQTALVAHLMSDAKMMQVGNLPDPCERVTLILPACRILSHTSPQTLLSEVYSRKCVISFTNATNRGEPCVDMIWRMECSANWRSYLI